MSTLSGQVDTDQLASFQATQQSSENAPAGDAKRAEAGWYPNAHGWTRLQYWDGEQWTQRFRAPTGEQQGPEEKQGAGAEQEATVEQDAGEAEERSWEPPAAQDKPVLEAHPLFWRRTKVIVSLPREPVRLNPVGIGLAFLGAALMIVGVFLPRTESRQFFRVPDNTLIQSGDGWIFVGLAVLISVAAYAAVRGRRRTYAVLILALLGVGIATYQGTGERLELSSLNPAAATAVGVPGEDASPGYGLYAVGAGSGLAALGGLLLTGVGARARTRLTRWATDRPWTAINTPARASPP
jgi:hypothetical protein